MAEVRDRLAAIEDPARWRALCEWLEQRPRMMAMPRDFPPHLADLVRIGNDEFSRVLGTTRRRYGLILYWPNAGWKLTFAWRDRLAQLEAKRP